MARINNLTNFLNDVAAAIKEKLGDSTNIPAAQFDTKIREIETGGDYQSKTINISANGSQTITPDSEYDALSSVVINVQVPVKQLQSKSYEFTDNTHIVLSPETGYDGFSSIELTINVPSSQINNQDKTITQNGTYTADSGYTGLGTVDVNVPITNTSEYSNDLLLTQQILGGEPQPVQAVVYGIKRLLSSTSPTWIRTDDSENMRANATIGGIEGTNDFDTAEIYKDIITQNYNTTTKQVVAEYGDQNFTFSPSDNDIKVMTYIPEFWAKRWQDNEYEYIQITNQETTGFTHIPSRRIGRYATGGTSSIPTIKSGQAPLVNITLPNLRTTAKSLNTDIALMDIWTWNILQILYLVEYASYNSQDKLGRGCVDGNSSALTSGGCDNLGMKSGCVTNDGKHTVIYRGIENFFGNVFQWLDGINFVGRQGYVCIDYTQYASDTTTNYIQLGYVCPSSNNYIGNLGYDSNNSLVMVPSAVGGSDTSGITDYYYGYNSGNKVSRVGGRWADSSKAGAFASTADSSSNARSDIGGRFVQYDSTAI